LVVHKVLRSIDGGQQEALEFEEGVNLLVGTRNTGKSKWLKTIDYLLGDEIDASERHDDIVFTKYDSAELIASVAGQKAHIQRRWKEHGVGSTVSVDGQALTLRDYRAWLMDRLAIPILHYPQGDPYGTRAWPEIGWRSIFRHVYRRQRFWTDLADQQPPSEQHACLMQFVGIASKIFSEDYGWLVKQRKRIMELEIQREQFLTMLQEVSRDLVDATDLGVALTPQSITTAVRELGARVEVLQYRRDTVLRNLEASVEAAEPGGTSSVRSLSQELISSRDEEERVTEATRKSRNRLSELTDYRNLLGDELARIERAVDGGYVLSDFPITNCPACDRPIRAAVPKGTLCYVCKEPTATDGDTVSRKRLDFEADRIAAELQEIDDLVGSVCREVELLDRRIAEIQGEQASIQQRLRPVQTAAAAILPPELAICDVESGQIQERISSLERIGRSLKRREVLAKQIRSIQDEVSELEGRVTKQAGDVDYFEASDLLGDGANTYLNEINRARPGSWTQERVTVRLSESTFSVNVGGSRWDTKLGGSLILYFLLAYQYALLNLSSVSWCRYPGFAMLDFPAEMLDGSSVRDKENFVIEPFVRLLGREDMAGTQLIAAGSSFEGLVSTHRIELRRVWR